QLDPENAEAALMHDHILTDQNPLGMAKDYDLIPDFPQYESVVTAYSPLVISMFTTAQNMLVTGWLADQRRQALLTQMSHLQGQIEVFRTQRQAADLALQAATQDVQHTDNKLLANDAEVRLREQELMEQAFEAADGDILGSIFDVFTKITSVLSP